VLDLDHHVARQHLRVLVHLVDVVDGAGRHALLFEAG